MHLVWYFHHIFSKWWCPYSQINDDFKLPINFLIRFFFILINDLGAKICNSYLSIFINCKKFQSCFSNISSIQQGIHTYIRCFVFVRVFSNTCFQIGLQILCPSGEKSRLVFFFYFLPLCVCNWTFSIEVKSQWLHSYDFSTVSFQFPVQGKLTHMSFQLACMKRCIITLAFVWPVTSESF